MAKHKCPECKKMVSVFKVDRCTFCYEVNVYKADYCLKCRYNHSPCYVKDEESKVHKSDCPFKDNPYLDGCLCSYEEEFETFREFKNALNYLGFELTVVDMKDNKDNEPQSHGPI